MVNDESKERERAKQSRCCALVLVVVVVVVVPSFLSVLKKGPHACWLADCRMAVATATRYPHKRAEGAWHTRGTHAKMDRRRRRLGFFLGTLKPTLRPSSLHSLFCLLLTPGTKAAPTHARAKAQWPARVSGPLMPVCVVPSLSPISACHCCCCCCCFTTRASRPSHTHAAPRP